MSVPGVLCQRCCAIGWTQLPDGWTAIEGYGVICEDHEVFTVLEIDGIVVDSRRGDQRKRE